MVEYDELSSGERKAIDSLRRLAAKWPRSLALFSNSGTLEVHKNNADESFTDATYIDSIVGISNDGGDRD